ncbi:phage holin family protein [Pseudobacteroides cellulosolvens]|uniref:phage holin family protein n=1 Tax=Pseudobacteroides cellulosolvens TaxID=35825 RepID=UPI001364D5C5|nr:phage holin family protein [Pseudobacteroides cellulosolvens]
MLTCSITLEKSIMNPEFHDELLKKHDLYSYTQKQIKSSFETLNLNAGSDADSDQISNLLISLKKSITPDLINMNLDSLVDGMFQYLNGKSNFLPDIVINTDSIKDNINPNDMTDHNQKYSYALSKIKKINLSLILQYFDRSDITDSLSIIKLYFYIINTIPIFLALLAVMLFIVAAAFSKSIIKIVKWLILLSSAWAALLLVSAIFIIYKSHTLENSIYPITSSIPLPADITLSYINDLLKGVWSTFMVLGFIIGLICLFLLTMLKTKHINLAEKQISGDKTRLFSSIKYGACIFLFMLVISVLINKSYIVKKEFLENNFPVIINKLKNYSTVTKIIPAKDTSIYMLLLKLVDKKDKTPIADIKMHLTGEASSRKINSLDIVSDENGDARYILDKGKYRLSFDSESFPKSYQMPSSVFFELKSAGTTIISIELDKNQDTALNKWGIAEIEIFDNDNIPVHNVELYVEGIPSAPGNPDTLKAVTNSEGIAVFRLNEGTYKIGFTNTTFPANYKIPSPIDISVMANSIGRYSLRLSSE